jgi:flagellar assembly protein FliH
MSVYKNDDLKVEKFEFNQFSVKTGESNIVKDFDFNQIDPQKPTEPVVDSETIRIERNLASKNDFKVDARVKQYRGLQNQEEEDFQSRLDEALKAKYEELSKKAYSEGIEQGRIAGKEEALSLASESLESNLAKMVETVEQIKLQKDDLLLAHKNEIQLVIKNISKWVALKEIKDDESNYLQKLLSNLIAEINSKNNLSLKVSQKTYDLMPEVIDALEKKVGTLENIKCEVSIEIENEGIILESSNGIVDASIDSQFSMIDKIFNSGL